MAWSHNVKLYSNNYSNATQNGHARNGNWRLTRSQPAFVCNSNADRTQSFQRKIHWAIHASLEWERTNQNNLCDTTPEKSMFTDTVKVLVLPSHTKVRSSKPEFRSWTWKPPDLESEAESCASPCPCRKQKHRHAQRRTKCSEQTEAVDTAVLKALHIPRSGWTYIESFRTKRQNGTFEV